MKKIIYMFFMVCTAIMVSACSNSLKDENLRLTQEVATIKNENEALKNEVLGLKEANEKLTNELLEFKEKIADPTPEVGEAIFKIYSADVNTYEKEVINQLILKEDLPLKEKLDTIAENLSKEKFDGLGIEIMEIEELNGKKIALINLFEKENDKNASWKTGYFQGSTGGIITANSLQETFLQKDYTGEWIDGVRFLYNKNTIEFDHVVGLSDIFYR